MSKKISCSCCSKYLGEIRDARLRKGIYHLCGDCEIKRKAAYRHMRALGQTVKSNQISDLFKGLNL